MNDLEETVLNTATVTDNQGLLHEVKVVRIGEVPESCYYEVRKVTGFTGYDTAFAHFADLVS